MAKRKTNQPPYWIRATEVICVACSGSHAHAVEIRCVVCDRSICPGCVAHVALEPFCPECQPRRRA